MAANYDVLYTRPDVETLGGTQTRNVQVIGARTKPHGVVFEGRAPQGQNSPTDIAGLLDSLAVTFEGFFQFPGVADVAWYQAVTPAQNLVDHAIIYVTSTSGNSSQADDFPYTSWTDELVGPAVKATRDYLDRIEGL